MRNLIRRIPGARRAYAQVRFLAEAALERWWREPQGFHDSFYLSGHYDFEAAAALERNRRVFDAIARVRPGREWGRALEIGCGNGVVTRELARRCTSVTAYDVSPVACRWASERCASCENVRVIQLDVRRGLPPGRYDLVFAMDVLESFHGCSQLDAVTSRLASMLEPGGLLVVTECRLPTELRTAWWQPWFPEGGDAKVEFIARKRDLRLVHKEFQPEAGPSIPGYLDHVIALFEGRRRSTSPVTADEDPPAAPSPTSPTVRSSSRCGCVPRGSA